MAAIETRLLARRAVTGGHWLYTGTLRATGYGFLAVGSRTDGTRTSMSVHRLAWLTWVGEIPEGWHVHHLCDERSCFNPKHLATLPPSAHHRRHKAPNERCRRGHRLDDPANVYVRPNGTRMCRACRAIRGA